jgi:hypothetical protein
LKVICILVAITNVLVLCEMLIIAAKLSH